MPETLPLSRSRRRSPALIVALGAVLGILAVLGITTVPAFAGPAADPVTTDTITHAFDSADTASAVTTARTALTDAAVTVLDARGSGLDLGPEGAAIDEATALQDTMERLATAESDSGLLLPVLMTTVSTQTATVAAQTGDLRARLDAAVAEKAAADAAAAAIAAANTPEGAKVAAQQIAADEFGWGGDQFSCLSSLWQKESSWNYQAYNASSGATGIPQALPGSKMASAGSDWQTNALTQIRWGLDYIQRAYGSPCAAWGHSQATNWY